MTCREVLWRFSPTLVLFGVIVAAAIVTAHVEGRRK